MIVYNYGQIKDIPEIISLMKQHFTGDYVYTFEELKFFILNSSNCVLIATDKDTKIVVGVIMYGNKLIYCLCVDKNYQNKKIGRHLLNCIIKLKINKDKNIYLHVKCLNLIALKLYEKVGFKIIKTVKDYYTDTSPPTDAYYMKYTLNDNNNFDIY